MVAQKTQEMQSQSKIQESFEKLKTSFNARKALSYDERMRLLDSLQKAIIAWEERLASAVDEDFGGRSKIETAMAEIYVVLSTIKYIKQHLKHWMRPENRETSLIFVPAKNRVIYQPKGVVGIIAPWNYPIQLALSPIAFAIAAGNRVFLKPSELTPKTSETLKALIQEVFTDEIAAVALGGKEVGEIFSSLPFNHLFFTGSTAVGRLIMKAAAENLVPVTLELGGKSPAIISKDYPLEKAIERLIIGKFLNAGQTCIAPDYVLIPEGQEEAFIGLFEKAFAQYYPELAKNPDYSAIISDRHHARLRSLTEEAEKAGAQIITINPQDENSKEAGRKLFPSLVLHANEDLPLMTEEIFGPILPIVIYKNLDEAIQYVNDRERPLALYFFSYDREETRRILEETISGGVCINETLYHIAQDDLPFGGSGASGMGSYHGKEGFLTFSHAKAVFYQHRFNAMGLMAPPYGGRIRKMLDFLIGKAHR